MTSPTSTLNPDTGEFPRLSNDPTRDLTYAAHGPNLRRPDATGEIQMPRFLEPIPGDQLQPIYPMERVLDPARDDIDPAVPAAVLPTVYVGRHRARPTLADRLERAVAAVGYAFRKLRDL